MNIQMLEPIYISKDISIKMDQISISVPFTFPQLAQGEHEQITKLIAAKKQYKKEALETINYVRLALIKFFKSALTQLGGKANKLDRIKVFCEADGSHISSVMLGLYFGKPLLNFTFNPSKLTVEGLLELDTLFAMTLPLGYGGLYSEGVISRLEFAVDVAGIAPADLVLLDTGKRKTTSYMGTTYHGRRGRPLVATLYDKAAEQKSDSLLTRIECRVSRRDMTLQHLVEMGIANPFEPLLVIPIYALDALAKESKDEMLAQRIQQDGLFGGIKNKYARKKVVGQLNEFVPKWWDTNEIWNEFRNVLNGFKPHYIGGIYSPHNL